MKSKIALFAATSLLVVISIFLTISPLSAYIVFGDIKEPQTCEGYLDTREYGLITGHLLEHGLQKNVVSDPDNLLSQAAQNDSLKENLCFPKTFTKYIYPIDIYAVALLTILFSAYVLIGKKLKDRTKTNA